LEIRAVHEDELAREHIMERPVRLLMRFGRHFNDE
jgi:hypothetical protein